MKNWKRIYAQMREAAEILGVSHCTVSRYVASGRLKAIDGPANTLLILRRDLKNFKRPPRGNPNWIKS